MKDKSSLRNNSRLKKTKVTWKLNSAYDSRLASGPEKITAIKTIVFLLGQLEKSKYSPQTG